MYRRMNLQLLGQPYYNLDIIFHHLYAYDDT